MEAFKRSLKSSLPQNDHVKDLESGRLHPNQMLKRFGIKPHQIRKLLKLPVPTHDPVIYPAAESRVASIPLPPNPISSQRISLNTVSLSSATAAVSVPTSLTGGADPATATETASSLPPSAAHASTVVAAMVLESHPLVSEYRNDVLPKLKKMMDRYFSTPVGGEPIEVFLKPGSRPEKLTVFIVFRKPRKMRRAVEKSGCINYQNFDVVVEKGPDLRYTAGQRIHPEHELHPLKAPSLPEYSTGFPFQSYRENNLLGAALVGGVVRIGGQLCGLTVFHFLKESYKRDDTVARDEHGPESSASGKSSDTSTLNSVLTTNTIGEPSVDTSLSGTEIFLQPWNQLGSNAAERRGIQMKIHSASGTRLGILPYCQSRDAFRGSGDLAEDMHCIMDWALVDLGDVPLFSNRYVDTQDGGAMGQVKTVGCTTDPQDKAVDILIKGEVYCKGLVSGIPCLLGLQNARGYGITFMVSTDRELCELTPICHRL